MAAKKDAPKIETDAPEHDAPEQQLEGGEEDMPIFAFPTEFYGNEWGTVVEKMMYWVKYIPGPFTYGSDIHEEGAWAVCSDSGEQSIVSDEEFASTYIAYPAQLSHEPAYLLVASA